MADFGLAKQFDQAKNYFRQDQEEIVKLPVKWLALESLLDGVFSENIQWREGTLLWCTPPQVPEEWPQNGNA